MVRFMPFIVAWKRPGCRERDNARTGAIVRCMNGGPTSPAPDAGDAAPRQAAPAPGATDDAAVPPPAPNQLTPEEQMALFEKELKETDWGHQPC